MRCFLYGVFACLSLAIFGCGGGGGNDATPTPSPTPRVDPYAGVPGPGVTRDNANRLAFVSFGSVLTMNPDGSDVVRVTKTFQDSSPAWSPDRKHIAFERFYSGRVYVSMIDPDGSNLLTLKSFPIGTEIQDIRWTPDGKIVSAFAQYGSLTTNYLLEVASGRFFIGGNYPGSWMPDSRHFVYIGTLNGEIGLYKVVSYSGGTGGIETVYVPTDKRLRGMENPSVPGWPEVSRDGGTILFSVGTSTYSGIFAVNVTTGDVTRLTTGEDFFPFWSPDGSKFGFRRRNGGFRLYDYYSANADGSGLVKLSSHSDPVGDFNW